MLQIIKSRTNFCGCSGYLENNLNKTYKDLALGAMNYYRNNIYGLKQNISDKDIIEQIFRANFIVNKLTTVCKGSSLKINICIPVDTPDCQF